MAVALALIAAASWGAADFLGGLLGRRSSALTVAVATQFVAIVLLLPVVALVSGAPTRADLWWGAAAGLGSGGGVVLLYRGLAIGRMAMVAPTTAVGAAVLPIVFGLATGERPGVVVAAGAVLALVAVALVSRGEPTDLAEAEAALEGGDDLAAAPTSPPVRARRRGEPGLIEAIGSGIGFGAFFILLDRVSDGAGMWPLLPMRVASGVLAVTLAAMVGASIRPPRSLWGPLLVIGVLDTVASTLYLLATRIGLLSLVAVVGSLYPAGTVLLARAVLHERIGPVQAVGLGLAAAGVTLITVG